MTLDLNNNRLYSGGADKKIMEWNVAPYTQNGTTLTPIRVLQGHSNWILAMTFDPITNRL